jgi:hypothetical protein
MTGCVSTFAEIRWPTINELATREADESVAILESAVPNESRPRQTGGVLGIPPLQRMGTHNLSTVRQGHVGRQRAALDHEITGRAGHAKNAGHHSARRPPSQYGTTGSSSRGRSLPFRAGSKRPRATRERSRSHEQGYRICGEGRTRKNGAIDRAVAAAPAVLRALVDALQALRGVAKVTAVTLATEFGTFSSQGSSAATEEDPRVRCVARPTSPVRGSSRRMMTMKAVSADPRISA